MGSASVVVLRSTTLRKAMGDSIGVPSLCVRRQACQACRADVPLFLGCTVKRLVRMWHGGRAAMYCAVVAPRLQSEAYSATMRNSVSVPLHDRVRRLAHHIILPARMSGDLTGPGRDCIGVLFCGGSKKK